MNITKNIIEFFTLDKKVLGLFGAILLVTLGEELWMKYVPTYFVALGGTAIALGIFKSFNDTLEALSQLPGGIFSDKFGRIYSAITFLTLGIIGYVIFLLAPTWYFLFIGAIFLQGTTGLLQPTIFSIIGDNLPAEKRTVAFSVQSILKRLPIIISPLVGGIIIARYGVIHGIKISITITIALVVLAIIVIKLSAPNETKRKNATEKKEPINKMEETNNFESPSEEKPISSPAQKNKSTPLLNKNLSFLLTADILARFGQAMVKYFIVIYVIALTGSEKYGLLISLQMTTSILSYIPAAWIASKIGRKPVITLTFICFAAYPFIILTATTFTVLLFGFFIAGLREFGEPARKAMIVNLSQQTQRGKKIGTYYTIRTLAIIPAGILGGLLWTISRTMTAYVATAIASLGLIVFLIFVKDIVIE